jgi:hypothetical protein
MGKATNRFVDGHSPRAIESDETDDRNVRVGAVRAQDDDRHVT